jgi:hypothetical protein
LDAATAPAALLLLQTAAAAAAIDRAVIDIIEWVEIGRTEIDRTANRTEIVATTPKAR